MADIKKLNELCGVLYDPAGDIYTNLARIRGIRGGIDVALALYPL